MRTILPDHIVDTTIIDRHVQWDDIVGSYEPDDWGDAPWDNCDGWEHTVEKSGWRDEEGRTDSHTYFRGRDGNGFVVIDDETVIGWGCVGCTGASKQVRFEAIAAAKRKATEQLVAWYADGWEVNCACARYDDYIDSLGGIYDDDGAYTDECVEECRHEVANQLENDGFIVDCRPQKAQYSLVDAMRDRIHRNLTIS